MPSVFPWAFVQVIPLFCSHTCKACLSFWQRCLLFHQRSLPHILSSWYWALIALSRAWYGTCDLTAHPLSKTVRLSYSSWIILTTNIEAVRWDSAMYVLVWARGWHECFSHIWVTSTKGSSCGCLQVWWLKVRMVTWLCGCKSRKPHIEAYVSNHDSDLILLFCLARFLVHNSFHGATPWQDREAQGSLSNVMQ